jgi:hypothetical protein
MSIDDVLRARTSAWGRLGERRAEFFKTIERISAQTGSDDEFDRRVRGEINSYEKAAADFASDWKSLGLKVAAPVIGAISTQKGHVLDHLCGITSWESAIALAGVSAASLLAFVGPDFVKLHRKRTETKASAGRALLGPFKPVLG